MTWRVLCDIGGTKQFAYVLLHPGWSNRKLHGGVYADEGHYCFQRACPSCVHSVGNRLRWWRHFLLSGFDQQL